MIEAPMQTPGEKLKQIRESQPIKITRAQVAKLINESQGIAAITAAIIRDLEDGTTKKWLRVYIEFAANHWGVAKSWLESTDSVSPRLEPTRIREAALPYVATHYAPLAVWQGTPIEHDVEFRPVKKVINSPVNLPEPVSEYVALEVFGANIQGRAPHGSTVIIRLTEIPPNNCLALVENRHSAAVLRGFLVGADGDLQLHPLNASQSGPEAKMPGQRFVGYVVAIIDQFDPRYVNSPNIAYNQGLPIPFRANP